MAKGAGEITVQCVDRDGAMEGYYLELTRAVDMSVIASSGGIPHA